MAEQDDLPLKISLVRKQSVFSKLTDKETEILASLLVLKPYPKEATIVTKGDPVDSVYFIVKGKADVRQVTVEDGKIVTTSVAQMGPDTAIGLSETGFYSLSGVRTATVVALEDMITYRLSLAAFNGFALAYPRVNEIMRVNNPDNQSAAKF